MKNDLYWMAPVVLFLMALLLFNNCQSQTPKKLPAPETLYEVVHTDAEWKKILTNDQFNILRRARTERAFTSPLNNENREGIFRCAADSTYLFYSNHKFNSGTGWPSFDSGNNLEYEWDGRATEVRCITCGGHLGHLFKDEGFTEANLRYCINGDALIFTEDKDL